MKAMQLHVSGGPEVLVMADLATPQPQAGEVLIKVATVGVNYADLMQRQGVYPTPAALPAVLGFEVAGVVVALGAGVSTPTPGTRVVAGLSGGGGYAEYAIAPAATVFPIPETLDFEAATALFLQGLTAYELLRTAARFQPGESVLVHAAAGGVGSLVVQLARLMGASKVIGTASTPEKLAFVRSLGADAISYSQPDWVAQVVAATAGHGANIILDSIGGQIGGDSLEALSQGGRLVVYGAASGQPTMIAAQQLSFKGQSVLGYSMGTQTSPAQMAEGMGALLDYLASGQLRITIGERYPLADAAAAHRAIAERRTIGKVVLTV